MTAIASINRLCLNADRLVISVAPIHSMPLSIQIVLACLLRGVFSIGAAALIMFGLPRRWIPLTVSFSTGLLLSMALLHLLPEALEQGLSPDVAFPILLGGILCFFMLEKFTIWRHVHSDAGEGDQHPGDDHCHDHTHSHHHLPAGHDGTLTILIGDGFHNLTDGLLIAAAFLADPVLGWSTTLAIIAHEVPREAGDFAVLLSAGWKHGKALFWVLVSSLAAIVGGLAGYFLVGRAHGLVPVIITVAASSFLYVAIADLMPRLKRENTSIGWHSLLLIAGVAVVALGKLYLHHH